MSEEPDSGYARLEDQIGWFDRKSQYNQRMFKWLKVMEIVAAATIPFFAAATIPYIAGFQQFITAFLGVLIVVLEGLQHLNQYHNNWVSYRVTSEALRQEKYLYMATTGPYDEMDAETALKHLAERVEAQIASEHVKWTKSREEARKELGQGKP